VRLRQLYSTSGRLKSHSFDSYTSGFLWFLLVQHPCAFSLSEVRHLLQAPGIWPEQTLASALNWFVSANAPLPDWAAMRIAQSMSRSHSSVVPKRVAKEFEQLFCTRYAKRFPDGMHPAAPAGQRVYSYRPASAALRALQFFATDPLGTATHYEPLSEIWNECVSHLHKLSNVIGKNGAATNTTEGWEAMPVELRRGKLHPLTDTFCQILASHSGDSGITVDRRTGFFYETRKVGSGAPGSATGIGFHRRGESLGQRRSCLSRAASRAACYARIGSKCRQSFSQEMAEDAPNDRSFHLFRL
jgi:hypothetical protein